MESDTFKPTFLICIEGKSLSKDITHEITSFVFTDNEEELDVLELSVTDRNLQFTDDPLFQEGNEITARFGYAGDLSPVRKTVIKDIDYDFPESGEPTIRIKAYDKGYKLAGKMNQKVWQKPVPGILYSEIAENIATANGLKPVITPTKTYHLRVTQSNQSDAIFLKELASKACSFDGISGYSFFIEDDRLHFHPKELSLKPIIRLEYFTDRKGLLRSFRPSTQSQGAKGAGMETKTVGVDPRKKSTVEHKANNSSVPDRTILGKQTYLVNGNTGEGHFKEQESGQIIPCYERSEGFCEEPVSEPAQDTAEAKFTEAELRQVEATAVTIGIPSLRAKKNIEIKGVGQKFSGIYYCHSVRHSIGSSGYSCEIKLKKNALGKGAGDKSTQSAGKQNNKEASHEPHEEPPEMVIVDADTGNVS